MRSAKYSLPFRILFLSIILLVLPLFIFAFLEFRYAFLDALNDAKKQMIEVTEQRESALEQLTNSKLLLLKELAYFLDIPKILPDLPSEKVNEMFRELVKIGDFFGIAIYKLTPENRFVNVASQDPYYLGRDYTESLSLFNFMEKKNISFFVYDHRPPHDPLFLVTILIDDKTTQKPVASLLVAFQIRELLQTLVDPITAPFPLNFALLTAHKIVFASTDSDLEFQLFNPLSTELRNAIEAAFLFGNRSLAGKTPIVLTPLPESSFFEFTFKGEQQLAYLKNISGTEASYLVYTSKDAIFKEPMQKFLLVYAIYCGILVIGGLIVSLFTIRMAKPFKNLSRVMEEVKNQNLNARYTYDRWGFEINSLGQIFNEMIQSLLEQMHRAEEERVKKETLAQELRIGHEVQQQILPQEMPVYDAAQLADKFIPAKEVGGDFYDAFIQKLGDKEKLVLAIADTSGKGISACLYSLGIRSVIRGFAKEKSKVSEIVRMTNNNFYDIAGASGMFATVFVGIYDSGAKTLSYCSCGHLPGIVLRNNGKVEMLANQGPAMGLMVFDKLEETSLPLSSGDTLLLYTDGVTEAHNPHLELFGVKRLQEFLEKKQWGSAQQIAEGLVVEVEKFSSTAPQHDDITILVMRIL